MSTTVARSALCLAVGAALGLGAVAQTAAAESAATPYFTWNNALVYFVITDRFANGAPGNDGAYGRPDHDGRGNTTATFHGGDIKGLTDHLDYLKSLGASAVWISAPYEQSHGWTGGGPSGLYAHYPYHGYYALDFTAMDAAMGTVEEFRTFVNEAHKRGIRVIMDVVMNHSGYATLKDMCDFGYGQTKDNWDPCKDWVPKPPLNYHQKPIDESKSEAWDGWWGKDWLIFGGYGEICGAGVGLNECIAFLPDFKNSNAHEPVVSLPQFLLKKWQKPQPDYDIPAAQPYRQGRHSVAEFQAGWLSSWVEEFGVDGFRCDTAKHVTKQTWKLLKEYSQAALQRWREKNKDQDPAASWTEDFFMVGEHWAFQNDPDDNSGYASKGGFDAMIDFSFNADGKGLAPCFYPRENTWDSYARMYGTGGAKPALNALSYISSHDTSLCRPKDLDQALTGLILLPGMVELFYGDETARKNDGGGIKDREQGTRSDMNFPVDIDSQSVWAAHTDSYGGKFSVNTTVEHVQKLGQFRTRNPAVGAGTQIRHGEHTVCRLYKDPVSGYENKVVIYTGEENSISVQDCFVSGDVLQDGYTGTKVTVENGMVNLQDHGKVVLLETYRPH